MGLEIFKRCFFVVVFCVGKNFIKVEEMKIVVLYEFGWVVK